MIQDEQYVEYARVKVIWQGIMTDQTLPCHVEAGEMSDSPETVPLVEADKV